MRPLIAILGVGLILAPPLFAQTSGEMMGKPFVSPFRYEGICVGKEDPPEDKMETGDPPQCMFYYNEKTDTFFRLHFKELSKGKNLETYPRYTPYRRPK